MEQLNESQKDAIIRKRQEMLNKMGVQNAGKMVNESIVSTNSANSGMAAKIAAIRNGAAKAELSQYINAGSKGATANNGFQIPEPKMKGNPNQVKETVKPEHRQELQNFEAPSTNSQELSAIESMFGGGDGPTRMSSNNGGSNMVTHNPVHTNLDIESASFPAFNPQAALQKKMQLKNQVQEEFVETTNNVVQPQVNLVMMQTMMETIAKGIAEKTIRSVLSEYTEQQKGKVFFEYYNKEKSIIKASDGKYYRLTQVELKKK